MKVGVCEATELKKRSGELNIHFADLLWGYVVEDLMLRIYDSRYGELLWLETYPVIGKGVYCEKERKTMRFCYIEETGKKKNNKISEPMVKNILKELFGENNIWKVHWSWDIVIESSEANIRFVGTYHDMEVPVKVVVRSITGEEIKPGVRQDEMVAFGGKRELLYPIYSPESLLCRELFTIIERLELINDMESYYNAYRLLKIESYKGRDVLDKMDELIKNTPKVKREQRIEQVAEYRKYAYMRKRWEKYARHHGHEEIKWEEVIDLIVTFLKPIWHCLCCDEIFFDDWMPDIGRFI